MALMNFIDKVTVVTAEWLNAVDRLKETVFNGATTKASARAALTQDAPLEIGAGGTGVRTLEELQEIVGGGPGGGGGGSGIPAVSSTAILDGPEMWQRLADGVTWEPTDTNRIIEFYFSQNNVTVGKAAWLVQRDALGILTGHQIPHSLGDMNLPWITLNESGSGTQVYTVGVLFDDGQARTSRYQTINTSVQAPGGGQGPEGPTGPTGPTGATGPAGIDPILYYIKPLSGTAIKNGNGTLFIEAHKVQGGVDTLLTSGPIRMYEGTSDLGYSANYTADLISGSSLIHLRDGPSGEIKDSITLVDIADGESGGVGTDAVYGYVEADGPLSWTRLSDQSNWDPSDVARDLDCTFVQKGAEVARVAYRVSRTGDGILSAAPTTHKNGDFNGSRVTGIILGANSQSLTVKFTYSFSGDVTVVSETVITSKAGANGPAGPTGPTGPTGPGGGATGPAGPPAIVVVADKPVLQAYAYQEGSVVSYTGLDGLATVQAGGSDVTAGATFGVPVATGCSGSVNTADNAPVSGKPKGYYVITSIQQAVDQASFKIPATYAGTVYYVTIAINKIKGGMEILPIGAPLPTTNLFDGRQVYRSSDGKIYRYTSGQWVKWVDGADLLANSVTANAILAGAVTAAKINVTDLAAINANLGNILGGQMTIGSAPARAGSSMTGTGFRLETSGAFALGNATTNITFDGTTMTFNGRMVNTSTLFDNAVTVPVGVYTSAALNITGTTAGTWTVVQTATINSTGAPIQLICSAYVKTTTSAGSPGFTSIGAMVKLVRDGATTLYERPLADMSQYNSGTQLYSAQIVDNPSFAVMDQPGGGAHTYTLQIFTTKQFPLTVSYRTMTMLEVKR